MGVANVNVKLARKLDNFDNFDNICTSDCGYWFDASDVTGFPTPLTHAELVFVIVIFIFLLKIDVLDFW